MEEKVYLDKLAKRDIKPTAIRLLILKSMMEAGRAVSQLDLETGACVTLYPALLSASASSSCVPILLLLINSNIFLCLSVLTTILQSYHFVISINYIQSHFISYSFKKRYPACLYKSCSLI